MSDYLINFAGLLGVTYAVRWILCTLYRIFYPYKIASPKNLHALASGEWAGNFLILGNL
jgi:hypothetical protein